MMRIMMKSKIHRATVTQADLDYVGSVAIDSDLLEAADLLEGEQVAIVDIYFSDPFHARTHPIRKGFELRFDPEEVAPVLGGRNGSDHDRIHQPASRQRLQHS